MRLCKPVLLPCAVALLAAGCAVTRVEPPPPVAAAPAYKEAGAWLRAPREAPVPDAWWTLYGDPVLDALQARLVVGNESLKSSLAAVASAQAVYEASRGALLPTLSAGLGATRSATTSNNGVAQSPSNSVSLSASASWELDLWGRLRQASSGAEASYQASSDELASARLSAQALLAQTYFSLRTADAQQALLQRSVEAYRRSLELTQARYDGGVAARSDVLQAQTQLASAQAQQAELRAQRAQLEHAIAVLVGAAPSTFAIAPGAELPPPPAVPQMLPATLLERRPDIAAAQRRVAAAYAQIGVADAAWFPDLTLSSSAGYRGRTLAGLVDAPNLVWSLGGTLSEVLFDGGQRRLASAQARASADQATASYRQTVLTALQEVEDNLVLADQLRQEGEWQQQALQAARRNLEITLDQYRAGTASYLAVVTAQTAAYTSESSWLALRNRQLAAVNQLLKNIAGRWQPV